MSVSFLPECDRAFLASKATSYREVVEEEQRGLILPSFVLPAGHRLMASVGDNLSEVTQADVLILVPKGYRTTKLDSFYTRPHLKLRGGCDPQNANGSAVFE